MVRGSRGVLLLIEKLSFYDARVLQSYQHLLVVVMRMVSMLMLKKMLICFERLK